MTTTPGDESETSRERVDRDHLDAIERTYIFAGVNLVRLLGLEGARVVKVSVDGDLWYITTRENIK